MNKRGFIELLQKETGRSENECIIINDCLEEYPIVGRKNKEKIMALLIERLNIDLEEANEIYNTSSRLILGRIKHKIIHPFKDKDK